MLQFTSSTSLWLWKCLFFVAAAEVEEENLPKVMVSILSWMLYLVAHLA